MLIDDRQQINRLLYPLLRMRARGVIIRAEMSPIHTTKRGKEGERERVIRERERESEQTDRSRERRMGRQE